MLKKKVQEKQKYPNWSYQKIICLRKQQSIGTADVQQQCVKCSEQGINQNWKEFPPQFLQIEGSDCHHGADELVGRCLALHQQRREEGQASGEAQVRKSSFNQQQMPWVSQHQRVSLLRKRISTSGALHPRQIKPVPAPPVRPRFGVGRPGVERAPARELMLLLVRCTLVELGTIASKVSFAVASYCTHITFDGRLHH